MGDEPIDLPQGTLDLLILKALALEPRHGWAIAERLHQISAMLNTTVLAMLILAMAATVTR